MIMIITVICLTLLGLFFIGGAFYLQYKDKCLQQVSSLKQLQYEEEKLNQNIKKQKEEYLNLIQTNNQYKESIEKHKNDLQTFYADLETQYRQAYFNYVDTFEDAYTKVQMQFEKKRKLLQGSIVQLKDELNAISVAKMREEKDKDAINAYRIQLTASQYKDINKLETWKNELHDPSVISKVIWSAYVMKPTSDLCNRLTEGKIVSGIYKITSLISKKVYIGQSVNITQRLKQHIKCGLGIDAPATNKLYNLMQEQGVFNFTFEILQECNKNKLNQRERFWIETYQSNKFGLNVQGGNK